MIIGWRQSIPTLPPLHISSILPNSHNPPFVFIQEKIKENEENGAGR